MENEQDIKIIYSLVGRRAGFRFESVPFRSNAGGWDVVSGESLNGSSVYPSGMGA